MNWIKKHKYHMLEVTIIIIVVGLIYIPIMYKQNFTETSSDYPVHSVLAQVTTKLNKPQTPHFLWHVIITLVRDIFFVNEKMASFIAITTIYCVLVLVLKFIFQSIYKRTVISFIVFTTVSVSIIIITPILMSTSLDKNLYFGYIGLATYHNPTIILLKLLALLHFYYLIKIFDNQKTNVKYIFISTVFIILATLSKPNYTICILPALFIYILYQITRRRPSHWKSIVFGTFFPAIIILLWQFYFTYQSNSNSLGQSDILFSPLEIMKFYSDKLLIKFFLSIAFPLAVFIIYFSKIKYDTAVVLSWVLFSLGCMFTYLFIESGSRKLAGNFFWSSQITLFILFIYSLLFLLKENKILIRKNILKNVFLGIVFIFHIVSGIFFYYFEYTSFHKYW